MLWKMKKCWWDEAKNIKIWKSCNKNRCNDRYFTKNIKYITFRRTFKKKKIKILWKHFIWIIMWIFCKIEFC